MIKVANNKWPTYIVVDHDIFKSQSPHVRVEGELITFNVDNGSAVYEIIAQMGPVMYKAKLVWSRIETN